MDASEWIVCPISGKKWPRNWASELRDCSSCGGKIDTRYQAWLDHMDNGATHWPGECVTKPEVFGTAAIV